MDWEWILLALGLTAFIAPFATLAYDKINGTHVACDMFGWHNGEGAPIGYDGCSLTSSCSKCGKKVMQDSQGNWF